MKPKTVLKWHEHAFLSCWRWKSRRNGGRPTISQEMRALIRRLSRENHSRRQVVHFAVTAHRTMAWVIQQLREGLPFGQQPTYLFRDNDGIYGDEVSRFLVGTGIAEVKTAHRCPWHHPFVGMEAPYGESCWIM